MNSPIIDILVPVWNNPFETRACLSMILATAPESRLVVVDNGSSRETELMLEEFSESLGERGLFIKSQKNLSLVAAINLGLIRSDADYTIILRPTTLLQAGWLDLLISCAENLKAGIITPLIAGIQEPALKELKSDITTIESCTISFEMLLLSGAMKCLVGLFDEDLDGAEWCLKEYVRRVAASGYRIFATTVFKVQPDTAQKFGSLQRREDIARKSSAAYIAKWGIFKHYCVYFAKEASEELLEEHIATLLNGARQGHRFTLLLHRRHYIVFKKMRWNTLHAGIEIIQLPLLFPLRKLHNCLMKIRNISPDVIMVHGVDGCSFPEAEDVAISREEMFQSVNAYSTATMEDIGEKLT